MKRLLINIGVIIVVALIICFGCMLWLDHWTRHGEITVVPDVKNLPYQEAASRLKSAGLNVELLDSVYESTTPPGSVLNQNPRKDAKVKPGRTVYVTINAFSPKMVAIPSLTDNSLRQARTTLNGLGITHITERRVPSEFRDLVLGVIYKGTRLSPGARVPVNADIILEIGEGLAELPDSLDTDGSEVSDLEMLDLF